VHSFCAKPTADNKDWIMTVTDYAGQRYISAIEKGNVVGTQFHPEKSHHWGMSLLKNFAEL
jgi:imidazoleglycerol phosphate synthase glutamine amidotransferase subunit HisH